MSSDRQHSQYTLYGGRYTRTGLVQMVLEEGGLPYELIELDMLAGEFRSTEYLAINPAGFVPALRTPQGAVLHETPAIMLYLTDTHDLEALAPAAKDPLRGEFLTGFFFCCDDIQPEIKRFYFPARYASEPAHAAGVHAQAREMLIERFGVIEKRLGDGRPFYLGERASMVDITLAFWASSVFPREAFLAACPLVGAHIDRVVETFASAHYLTGHHEAALDYWANHLGVD